MIQDDSGTYRCMRCGACCRWPGTVRISAAEAESIAAGIGMDPADFTAQYTMLAPDRCSLILTERPDGACIFLEGDNHCRIQAVKPQQCRDFPDKWRVPGFREVCRAVKTASE